MSRTDSAKLNYFCVPYVPGIFGDERFHLQIDHEEAAKLQVVEQQMEIKFGLPDNHRHLPTGEREPGPEFQQQLLDVSDQPEFQVSFHSLFSKGQEVEQVGIQGQRISKLLIY